MRDSKIIFEITKYHKGESYLRVLPTEWFTPVDYMNNLINQLRQDVFPLFNVEGAAPFTVLRNTFCFADHVSTLKYGKSGGQTERMKKLLSEFASFDTHINSKYKRYAEYLIQIYRHDLVHNIRPLPKLIKVIEVGKSKLSDKVTWFFISSLLDTKAPRDFESLKAYLKNTRNRKNLGHLRYIGNQIFVNNYCIFFDLVNYLEEYKGVLSGNKDLQKELAKNYKGVVKENSKKISNFVLNKNKDKEVMIYEN